MAKKPAKTKSKTVKNKKSFSHREFGLYMLVFALVGAITLWVSFAAPVRGGCAITPSAVALDQVWTVNASGLPAKSTVNQIITFPDGGQSTGPINVSSNGTYSATGNSNMSASWGFIAPEQTGTYRYQYVGKLKWPAGTFNTTYATCTVQVSS